MSSRPLGVPLTFAGPEPETAPAPAPASAYAALWAAPQRRRSWRVGLGVAAILHVALFGLLLFVEGQRPVTAPAAEPLIIAIEAWPMPMARRAAQPVAATAPAAEVAGKPVPAIQSQSVARPVTTPPQTSVPTPIPAPSFTPTLPAAPVKPAQPAPHGVVSMPDQKQVMANLAGRNAAAAAIISHDVCVNQRSEGKEVSKDCPLNPTRKIVIDGPAPKQLSDRQKCIQKRHDWWKKYREGTATYPGFMNMLGGNADCRKGWDD